MPGPATQFVERTVSRLKFPQAFTIFVVLFLFDLVVPDLVPFVDEILLGLGAALFGMWRERVPANAVKADKPPEKNVTPPG
ncbi:MAG: DUF6116 family protein [Thermoanaerobaculia bacterium]